MVFNQSKKEVMTLIFYDYEVFKEDWLVVIKDTATQSETVIVNDPDKLKKFNEAHEVDLWVGYNKITMTSGFISQSYAT